MYRRGVSWEGCSAFQLNPEELELIADLVDGGMLSLALSQLLKCNISDEDILRWDNYPDLLAIIQSADLCAQEKIANLVTNLKEHQIIDNLNLAA